MRFAEEKKICANVYFLLLLEEEITATAESRGAGCSLLTRFSVSTVGLERSEKTTTSLPFRSRSRSNVPAIEAPGSIGQISMGKKHGVFELSCITNSVGGEEVKASHSLNYTHFPSRFHLDFGLSVPLK